MSHWGYAPDVSVAQKKAKAEKKLKQLKKKMPDIGQSFCKVTASPVHGGRRPGTRTLNVMPTMPTVSAGAGVISGTGQSSI